MKIILLFALLMLSVSAAYSQLKIGSNPSQINKSSILELESTRQGLLLPRVPVSNLTVAPLNTAPDGMIIYVTDSSSLFIRKNNTWQQMSADSINNTGNWNVKGNAGLDSAVNFLGTTNLQPVILKSNNIERLRITGSGEIKIAAGTIPTGTNQVQVLVIDPVTGTLLQRNVTAAAFSNAIVSLNGLRDSVQTFAVDSAVSTDFTITSATGKHTFNIPSQDGNAAVSRGLLTHSDWLRFDSAAKAVILHTLFSNTPDANGISISNNQLTLHAADATNPGGVSTAAQTFGGDKTFQNNVAITQNATVTGNLILTTIPVAAPTDSNYILIRKSNGVIAIKTLNVNALKQLVTGTDSGTVKDINIDSSSASQTVINVPDASKTVRGVVNIHSGQIFGGYKNFRDSLGIGIASGTAANSTFQINGSIATNLTKISSSYSVTVSDNTILADATGSAITITLPAPGTINGRIYTIKKIGSGGIDNAVTISPSSGTIDGGASFVIYNDWTFVTVQTDGTNWYVIKN